MSRQAAPTTPPSRRASAGGSWTRAAVAVLERLVHDQDDALEAAAELCAAAIGGGGLVHVSGTGHSRMAVEEMFPRYGSFAGFQPMVELSTTFHTQVVGCNGQRQAMFVESVEGLAEVTLRNFTLTPPDCLLVISASGLTANSLETARGFQARGLPVIAVTSVRHSEASAPTHSSGTRLLDNADVVIDLGTPVGDALVEVEGLLHPVGPGSSVASIAVINEIKVRTAERLVSRRAMTPVLTSKALVGPAESARLFDAAYDEQARRVARALTPPADHAVTPPDLSGETRRHDER